MEPGVEGLHRKQQGGASPSSNLGKEKGKEVVVVVVEKVMSYLQQPDEESLHMRRLRILEGLGVEASDELRRKNLMLLQMETLDKKKLQPAAGKGKKGCNNSSDGKQKEVAGRDENKGLTEDSQGGGLLGELQRLDPGKLRRRVYDRRIYNQRYRLKQEKKRLELEDMYKCLMKNMKALPGMILHCSDQMARLKNENNQLRKKIAELKEHYYRNSAQMEMKVQEVRQLRELYNIRQVILMQQQGQQFHQNQLMPPQPGQPFPYNYYVLASIFS